MRTGKELIGKPIYSITDGSLLGSVKDLYLGSELGTNSGLYLGSEGLFSRKSRFIAREDITVLGLDAILASGPDVVTDSEETDKAAVWLRREDIQGRELDTSGGTKVGTVGDILFDEIANISGFALARVHVTGPVAESRLVLKEAILDTGGVTGKITVDLSKAERPTIKAEETIEVEDVIELDEPDDPDKVEEPASEESEMPIDVDEPEESEENEPPSPDLT